MRLSLADRWGVQAGGESEVDSENNTPRLTLKVPFDFDPTRCRGSNTAMPSSTANTDDADMFTIVKATTATLSPRLGRLSLPSRNAIETPHYLGLTSRGVVPHLSQDNFDRLSSIAGVYAALEDCRCPAEVLAPAPTR